MAALAVSAFGLNANAQSFSGEDGKYYLQNVASGLYWGAGNSWGTQASLLKNPEYVTLVKNPDGTYKMDSQVTNGGENHYFNGDFMDNNSPVPLTITVSGDYYTIANDAIYYGWDGGASTVLGKNLEATSPNALWKIISEADMKASLANATAENPVNATFLILDPNFSRNNRNKSSWSMVASNQQLAGGDNTNMCAESYHAVFTLSQKIENAPKGVYKLNAQGFYREDEGVTADIPYIYINDEKSPFNEKTGAENNMGDASASFTSGLYAIAPAFVELTADGDITVGAKLENSTNLWCIWDNFELTYYGPDATIAEVRFGDLIKQVETLREQAEALKANENVSAPTVAKLEAALSDSEDIEEKEEAYNAAIATLTAAVQQANKDVANKPAIDAMYELMESTNVYTTDAYNTYKALADDYLSKYEAGTLTETVVNPSTPVGWNHNAAAEKTFLISAWSIGGEKANDYEKALYINNWSIEGYDDGTNFGVPFFEYFVDTPAKLGETAITATVDGLNAGLYKVTAWVRSQITTGATAAEATGITLSVNEGEAVDVTEGEVVNDYNLAEYTAYGEVGEDGKLTITFDVAADNNIHWLSFKNVKYTKLPTPIEIGNYNFDENPDDVVTVTTRGYGKDVTGDQKTGLQPVQAWTPNPAEPNMAPSGGSGYTGGVFAYGSSNKNNNQAAAPATNPEGGSEGVALALSAVWSGTAQYTQNVTLPAGNYTITYPVYNGSGTTAFTKSLFGFIAADGTEYLSNKKSFKVGEWETETVEFTLYQETTGDISVGFISVNDGTGANQHLFVDHVSVIQQSDVELADAQEYLLSKIEGLTPVGEGLFYYQTEEVAKAKAAIEAATTQKEIDAVEMPKKVLPVEGKPYAIANTEAEGNLSVGENITVQIDAVVYFTPVNGGYAISNEAGEYIFKTNTGSWDNYGLSNTTELAKAYVISVNPVEGGYTLDGTNGSLGTDETETGSKVWANKGNGDGHYIWTIAEYVPTSYDVTVTEAGWATWVTPADIDFAGVEAYVVSTVSDDDKVTAQLVAVETALEGTPVIIKAAQGTHTLAVTEEATEVGKNLLEISEGGESGEDIYVLANLGEEGEEVVGFYALEEGYSLPAGKVYLPYSAAGVKFIGFGDGNATGINGVENAANGVENAVIYNVAGQRVSNPTKGGIYIINGKKVLVK